LFTANNKGFTLLELLAVVMIVAVIFTASINRFGFFNSDLHVAKKTLLDSLFVVQKIAMSRADSANSVTFSAINSYIDIRENNRSVQFGAIDYPQQLPSGITVTQGVDNLAYDKLGNTAASKIVLSSSESSLVITIEASGYAYE